MDDVRLAELPRLISVDDHVVEPKDLWVDRLPAAFRDRGPTVHSVKAVTRGWQNGNWAVEIAPDDPEARWVDMWRYEDTEILMTKGFVAAGFANEDRDGVPVNYDEDMRPGCFRQADRLADMDLNHTDASLCFPTIPRFCGQLFLEGADRDLALACVRTYNDWMIDEWCAGDGFGRLIPLTIVPLWDAELAAAEIRRCAAKGSHAVAFSESPAQLGLPSLYSGYWDPFIAACEETDTVINMHVGSASVIARPSNDAPHLASSALFFQYGMYAVIDWILSGALARFPQVRIALSEAQVGWLPFIYERLDKAWARHEPIDAHIGLERAPSTFGGQIFGCVFDDLHGLISRETVGIGQIMLETDYPHADSTWPNSRDTLTQLVHDAGLSEDEIWQVARGNAIRCYGLDKYFGITK